MPAFLRRGFAHVARTLPWTLLTGAILAARVLWPPRSLDAEGPVALRDLALTLALCAVAAVAAHGLGAKVLRLLSPPGLTGLEAAVASLALGLGGLGYGLFALGMFGLLHPSWIAASLLGLSLWVGPEARSAMPRLRRAVTAARDAWRSAEPLARVFAVIAVLITALAFSQSIAPPTDPDGLMYHLEGPRLFVESGRLYPLPDNWYVNGAFAIEMLFSLGMAFGDDVFPRLIHLTFGVMLVLATAAAGRRWLGKRGAWLSAAVLLGVPALPVWASLAYIDLAWALFEFLAFLGALTWWQNRSGRWLAFSAVTLGLAMGSKYLGLMGFAVLGGFVALASARLGWKPLLRNSAAFGGLALLVASPWYLRNLAWFGNPVFPLYFGGPGWTGERWELYQSFLGSFGTGRGLIDFVLLPINLYVRHAMFGTFMNRLEIPAFLFPILLAYPFVKKRPEMSLLLALSAARLFAWALGSFQIRFQMPVYPILSVGAAYVALQIAPSSRSRLPWRDFAPILAVAFCAATLAYQGIHLSLNRPLPVALGVESRRAYLTRIIKDFPAWRHAEEEALPSRSVLLLGDGRGYYCPRACVPDPDHFRWASEIAGLPDDGALTEWLEARRLEYVLLSTESLDFLLQHDPTGVLMAAVERVFRWREAGCLRPVYDNGWAALYAVACRGGTP